MEGNWVKLPWVKLPWALARKHPTADRKWVWQSVFPPRAYLWSELPATDAATTSARLCFSGA